MSRILFFIISSAFFLLAFSLSPQPVMAATIPYQVTAVIPNMTIATMGTTFLTKDLVINYQSGKVLFSSNSDGTGSTSVDDGVQISVVHPDGTTANSTFEYHGNCFAITPKQPQDVTSLLKPGENKVSVRLYDVCGTYVSSSPLYLVNTDAPDTTQAVEYFFRDEFNQERTPNTLDPEKWIVYPNDFIGVNTIRETGGNLVTYQSPNQTQFPLIVSKNQAIPSGDFSAEIKFQYTHVTSWGTGIVFTANAPTNGGGFNDLFAVNVWQDKSVGPNMRVSFDGVDVYTIPTTTDPHIFKVEKIGQNYLVYLDNNLVFTSPNTAKLVKYIWMGNPSIQSPIPEWTRFNVDYIRVISLVPTKIPLILIPGIGGSEFKMAEDTSWSKPDGHGGTFNHTYKAGEKVWVNEMEAAKPGDDDYFDILRMRVDGVTPEANLDLTGEIFAGAYQPTIDFFTANGYELNKTLFIFPYDWRKDISSTAALLDQKISQIKQQTGAPKVDIITHSMGGLVARNYISDSNRAQNIRKFFALGTPHLGSPKFIHSLLYGNCLYLEIGPLCLVLAPSEVQDVIQNMISGYELAPSQKYFDFYNGNSNNYPFPFRDDADIDHNGVTGQLNYQQIKDLLTNLGHNTSLFTPSEAFHNLDNNLSKTNGAEVYIISGSGIPTLGQIIERNIINFTGIKIPKKDQLVINGDDTVPLYSSSLNDPSRNLSLSGSANIYYTNQKHGKLVSNGPSLNLIKNILAGNNQLPDGVSTNQITLKGQQLSVHSPVNIHVYDASGNHTGPTPEGDFEENIPGSAYDSLDDAKFVWLPEDAIYNIVFESTGDGSFDFKIRDFKNDTNAKTTIYKDVPLTINTKAKTILDTTSPQPPILEIDQDNNGTADFEFKATSQVLGDANFDQIPPQTKINLTGTKGDNNWFTSKVKVELQASDTGGSAVAKTEYTLDDGVIVRRYLDPFEISEDGIYRLKVKSTDNNGNEEIPQEVEIKIDKTAPEAKIFVDQDKQDLVVEGIDDNQITITKTDNKDSKKKDDASYFIKDQAGNSLKLDVRERDREKQDRFRIYLLQYNNNPAIPLENNHYNVSYQDKKDKLSVKEQNFEIKGDIKIKIKYDQQKNKSTIITKESGEEKTKEIKDGLILLQLITNQGALQYSY